MGCFDIYDVEDYKFDNKNMNNYKSIDNYFKTSIINNENLLDVIKIWYHLLKNNEYIEQDNIFNYIFPFSQIETLKILIECSKQTERIHVNDVKIGDIIERDIECVKHYYKVVKLDELHIYFKKIKTHRIYDKRIKITEPDNTNKKIEKYKKSYVASIFYNDGLKKLDNDKHLIRIKPLLFDTLYMN